MNRPAIRTQFNPPYCKVGSQEITSYQTAIKYGHNLFVVKRIEAWSVSNHDLNSFDETYLVINEWSQSRLLRKIEDVFDCGGADPVYIEVRNPRVLKKLAEIWKKKVGNRWSTNLPLYDDSGGIPSPTY